MVLTHLLLPYASFTTIGFLGSALHSELRLTEAGNLSVTSSVLLHPQLRVKISKKKKKKINQIYSELILKKVSIFGRVFPLNTKVQNAKGTNSPSPEA